MNDKEINELAGAWAADAIRRGRAEGRSGRLYDELVPAYLAGFAAAVYVSTPGVIDSPVKALMQASARANPRANAVRIQSQSTEFKDSSK